MIDNSNFRNVDYSWFDTRFRSMFERLTNLENTVHTIEQNISTADKLNVPSEQREYYSVQEFATHVERAEYTVREWCRYSRIHAEKCDTGRGEAKSWKIPVEELQRYRDHGLLPAKYSY